MEGQRSSPVQFWLTAANTTIFVNNCYDLLLGSLMLDDRYWRFREGRRVWLTHIFLLDMAELDVVVGWSFV